MSPAAPIPSSEGSPQGSPDSAQESATGEAGLTPQDREMLSFEKQWWRRGGAKEQAIKDHFGLSATRYYQLLNGLLDKPAALEYAPTLIRRLRRLRKAY